MVLKGFVGASQSKCLCAITCLYTSMTEPIQQIKVGMKVRITTNRNKKWFWKFGWVADIKGNSALINYGTLQNPNYGMGLRVPLSKLKIMDV